MQHNRRQFLETSARLFAFSALAQSFPGHAIARTSWYPFRLGVASGSPRPTGIILWTRLVAEPLVRESIAPTALSVRWEIAEDEGFRRIAASGTATALPELAHSVHVEVEGLKADRWYWYRFMLGDAISPVARTRTAPAAEALPDALRFAFASCQHWEFGQYAAHRHIAASAPDLIVFLGDYIYEWGPYDIAHPTSARRTDESFTLADYRARYAQYKTDPHLQEAHRVAPWIVAWDDHEVANDYGADRDERLDLNFLARRAAAYQAFYEHMPVRLFPLPTGANRFAHMRSYDRYDWGRLARFNVLDDRQYRSHHACPKPGRGGSNSVTRACAERVEPSRTMLGAEQEAWLAQGFSTSRARWNFVAQQTLMAQNSQVPVQRPGDGQFWTDGWDGYPAARQRLLADLVKHRPANPIVISGDVHSYFAADLLGDFYRPRGAGNPVIATEFCGTSVTSPSRPQARTAEYVAQNPHLKYGRSDKRGFVMMEVTPKRSTALFQSIDDITRADSGMTTLARLDVMDGAPGIGPS
jgi:alkaline phosphatase D